MAKRKRTKGEKTQKTKDRATQTSLKQGVNSGAPEGQAVFVPLATSNLLAYHEGHLRS
jgi:hypothetical protein